MGRVRERMGKLGLDYGHEDDEEGANIAEAPHLPRHLHELLASDDAASDAEGVWSPAQKDKERELQPEPEKAPANQASESTQAPVVWTPKSAGSSPVADRKEFRPIKYQSPTLPRKNTQPPEDQMKQEETRPSQQSSTEILPAALSADLPSTRLVQSHSAPASGLSSLVSLPRAQNPTITLLQKAREGQLPKGASYIGNGDNNNEDRSALNPNDILFEVKREYETDTEDGHKKVTELTPKKYDGIGPITKEGIPLVLRSEIRDANQARWYKRMYDSLHRSSKDDDYVTVRYRPTRGSYQPPHGPGGGGYVSEPDRAGYHSDIGYSAKYATLDRRRIKNKENDFTTNTLPRSKYLPHPNSVKYYPDVYRNQPGRIEDYVPGRSSISDKETQQWWDEVLEIFDGEKQDGHKIPVSLPENSFLNRAVKVSGYESDSTLVFKRRDENLQNQLSPAEQKIAYKSIQKGGEVPLHGLRKPAPERPKEPVNGAVPGKSHSGDRPPESPHRYVESEVTIHYRSPVRSEAKQVVSEEELARRQAEAMRRIYQEERRRKYLQELQDMNSRRHTDNFTPSQKSPIPLNRYDDILDDVNKMKPRDRTPEPKLVARALYNFIGQTSRELSFRRGDIIFVKRQIDKNWYEGEHNAMVGLFPLNYVEIIPYDGIRTMPKRASEGQARAKFNFTAQTYLELPLVKGELVVLTRRVDDNWYEGRIGSRKGIFPVSYVEVLQEPGTADRPASKAVSSPAMVNGSRSSRPVAYQPGGYLGHNKPLSGNYATLPRHSQVGKQQSSIMNQALHIDTRSEPVPYRALYNYCPQNDDELELMEGDMVYVMEKCDDGWYVGSSQRTGYFGTFPGNYVERI